MTKGTQNRNSRQDLEQKSSSIGSPVHPHHLPSSCGCCSVIAALAFTWNYFIVLFRRMFFIFVCLFPLYSWLAWILTMYTKMPSNSDLPSSVSPVPLWLTSPLFPNWWRFLLHFLLHFCWRRLVKEGRMTAWVPNKTYRVQSGAKGSTVNTMQVWTKVAQPVCRRGGLMSGVSFQVYFCF